MFITSLETPGLHEAAPLAKHLALELGNPLVPFALYWVLGSLILYTNREKGHPYCNQVALLPLSLNPKPFILYSFVERGLDHGNATKANSVPALAPQTASLEEILEGL